MAAQLDRPERAEVEVPLVVERVVQGGRAVVDLGVQLRGRGGREVEPVALGEEPDQRVQRCGDGVAVVLEQRDRPREPDRERVGDVGPGPVAQAPVHAVPVVERGGDQCGLDGDPAPARPRDHERLQAFAGSGVLLMVVRAEDETHEDHPTR